MPKQIILVRHGQTDFNKELILQGSYDTFLNKTGFEQAQLVSNTLAKEKIDIIYSSDLKRAYQTAQVIAKRINISIMRTPLLRERNFGGYEGLKGIEIRKIHTQFSWERGFYDPVSRLFGVETDKQMDRRIKKFLKHLKINHKNKHILVVTHGGMIWRFIHGFNQERSVKEDAKRFTNTSITVFEKIKEKYILVE